MRLFRFVALVFALLALTAGSAEDSAQPDLDLAQWEGRVVLLDFWASWCAPCRDSFPWMTEMRRKYGDQGLVIVTVNLDEERSAADTFLENAGSEFEALFDPEGAIAERFDLETMPTSILFDREGKLAFRHAGFHRKNVDEYEQRIVALLDGTARGLEGVMESRSPRKGVRPWERDLLADEAMSLNCDPLDLEFDDHIYFSKEASSGGRGFGGGGCGCN